MAKNLYEYNRRNIVVVKQYVVTTLPDDPLPASAINVRSGLKYRQTGLCGSLLTHEADRFRNVFLFQCSPRLSIAYGLMTGVSSFQGYMLPGAYVHMSAHMLLVLPQFLVVHTLTNKAKPTRRGYTYVYVHTVHYSPHLE